MNWQPISSCRRGKKEILVAWSSGGIEIMQGYTAKEYAEPEMEGGAYLTHWMPLPTLPKKTKPRSSIKRRGS